MLRVIVLLFLSGVVVITTGCARSIHQTDRSSWNRPADAGYGEAPYWRGAGYWGNPFGYYGPSYGWYGGGHRGAHHSTSPPSPPPTPPANAPPQFKK